MFGSSAATAELKLMVGESREAGKGNADSAFCKACGLEHENGGLLQKHSLDACKISI